MALAYLLFYVPTGIPPPFTLLRYERLYLEGITKKKDGSNVLKKSLQTSKSC